MFVLSLAGCICTYTLGNIRNAIAGNVCNCCMRWAGLNSIPAVAVHVLINHNYLCILQLSEVIDCLDPLLNITLMDDTLIVDDRQGISVVNNTINSTVTLEDIFTVLEDQHYTVSVSLTIINGTYTVTTTTSFSELITVDYTLMFSLRFPVIVV